MSVIVRYGLPDDTTATFRFPAADVCTCEGGSLSLLNEHGVEVGAVAAGVWLYAYIDEPADKEQALPLEK